LLIKVCITILPQRQDDSSVINKGLYHNITTERDDSSVVNKGLYHNITTERRRQQCC